MGIHDREYTRSGSGGGAWGGQGGRGGFPGMPRIVTVNAWLIIINIAVYVIGGFIGYNVAVSSGKVQWFSEGVASDQTLLEQQYYVQLSQSLPPEPIANEQVKRGWIEVVTPQGAQRLGLREVFRFRVSKATGERVGREFYIVENAIQAYGYFSTFQGFLRLEVWRLVTFQFLHAGVMHIFFNMLGLWIFGGMVEQYLGSKRYLAFYLMCGIAGGLLYLLLNLIGAMGIPLPGALAVDLATPLVGASAGVFGVIMACAYISPNTVVQLLFPPIPMKMKTFAYGYLLIVIANLFIIQGSNQGGDAAHLGGAIAGFFFIRRPHLLRDFFDVFGDSRKKSPRPRAQGRSTSDLDKEVDRILDKVNAEGLHSLSAKEKKTLTRAREQKRG